MVRIASWNVNGIRSCAAKGFSTWLEAENPDFVCIQETKAQKEQLSADLLAPTGKGGKPYKAYFASAARRGYSGTAVFSKREAESVTGLGIPEFDDEGRVLSADFGDFTLISAYFPNSQEAGARLDYKLRFCDAIISFCGKLRSEGRRIVLSGDYNIAHEPIDLARPDQNEGNAGYLPEERAWMDFFIGSGYVDTFRRLHPEPNNYTWWTYRVPSARLNNIGWRLDYHCVDEEFFPAVVSAGIEADVTGSDHCPVSLELDI